MSPLSFAYEHTRHLVTSHCLQWCGFPMHKQNHQNWMLHFECVWAFFRHLQIQCAVLLLLLFSIYFFLMRRLILFSICQTQMAIDSDLKNNRRQSSTTNGDASLWWLFSNKTVLKFVRMSNSFTLRSEFIRFDLVNVKFVLHIQKCNQPIFWPVEEFPAILKCDNFVYFNFLHFY